jgi:hypothetical protein
MSDLKTDLKKIVTKKILFQDGYFHVLAKTCQSCNDANPIKKNLAGYLQSGNFKQDVLTTPHLK